METQDKGIDRTLLLALFAMVAVGLTLVYSATFDEAAGIYWKRQALFFGLGLLLMLVTWKFPLRFYYVAAYPLYFCALILLLYVIVFKSGQVERWIALPGGFNLQPSEFAKFTMILVAARYFSANKVSLLHYKSLFLPGFLFFIPFVLVLKQPNLSTALVFITLLLVTLYWNGIKAWEIFLLISPLLSVIFTFSQLLWAFMFLFLIVVMVTYRVPLSIFITACLINIAAGFSSLLLWNKILKAHQRSRVLTFINPMRDPRGEGYQVIQSKVTIGSGGLWGKGFGEGSQTNLSFLPEEHTDFIFSVLGEQFGFVGAVAVLLLFFFLIYRVLRTCKVVRSPFHNIIIVGVATVLSFHVIVNVAMTIGLMPVTGVPLPFLSYGGSFVMVCMMMMGLVFNIQRSSDEI